MNLKENRLSRRPKVTVSQATASQAFNVTVNWRRLTRSVRMISVALLAASLLLGLIPPPLVSHVAMDVVPEPLAEPVEALADALPQPSVAYAATVNITDGFESGDFVGNPTAWAGSWAEEGETNGASTGRVRVETDEGDQSMRLGGARQVSRPVNLTGATSATLAFDYRRQALNESVTVEMWDGTTWSAIGTIVSGATETGYTAAGPFAITYLAADSAIRFNHATGAGSSRLMIDDVEISAEFPEGTITIVKNTDGTDATFTFSSADGDLNGLSIPTTGGTGTSTIITKTIGSYVISEDTLAGWGVTSITFSGDTDGGSSSSGSAATIDLDEGENIVVTFNNGEIIACGTNLGDLGGTVWRDFDSDGTTDASEPGFTDVTVTAYDNNGLIDTATVLSDGTYNFDDIFNGRTGDDAHIRLEFSGLPSWMESGVQGTNSGTTVQRHSAATCTADLAVQNPAEYCEDNPNLIANCYVNGANDPANTPNDVLVQFPYAASGTTDPNKITIGTNPQIGTTWGLAHSRSREQLFSAAFLKRHSALGPAGLGGIYVTDLDGTANGTTFVTIPNVGTVTGRDLGVPTGANTDPDAFGKVGLVGLGDMDISDDEQSLYVTNLNDRSIYIVDIDSAAVSAPIAVPDPGCTDGEHRPFATKYRAGQLYVGVICDGSTTPIDVNNVSNQNMDAYVYTMDTTTNTFNTTPVLQFPLDYAKGSNSSTTTSVGAAGEILNLHSRRWHRWENTYSGVNLNEAFFSIFNFWLVTHPTPILTDIEFDDSGNMILGFVDRMGHQMGVSNGLPDGRSQFEATTTGGDIVRATPSGANQWQIETTLAVGGEFFTGESFETKHEETAHGGLALLPGSQEVVVSAMDPLALNSGGIIKLSTSSGGQTSGFELYAGSLPPFLGKAAGIGDVELICEAAPLEIGNYVWLDDDGDGIQDPCEDPIPGVTVTLYDITGTQLASAVTDASGEYYFINGDDPRLSSTYSVTVPTHVGVVPTTTVGLVPNTAYQIRIDTTQTAVAAYELTTPNVDSGTTITDAVDSDGILTGNVAIISLTTGDAGTNDHTFDFGFVPAGTITIVKNTDGTDDTFDFTSTDADLNAVSITTVGATGSSTTITKAVGTYTITEDALAGWTLDSIAISGTDGVTASTTDVANLQAVINLDAGDAVTVTFTNRAAEGTITLVKNTLGTADGTFTFTSPDSDLDAVSITTASNVGSSAVITKTAGTYTITEDALAGWTLTDISVAGDTTANSASSLVDSQAVITLDEDENITVTFTNAPDPIASLSKTLVSPASGSATLGSTVSFALRVENTGPITVSQVTLVDTYDPNYLTFGSAAPTESSTTANTITWSGVDGDGGSLDGNLPLAPGGAFTVTVNFTATRP